MLTTCCCGCCDLKSGVMVIAIVLGIFSVITIISGIVSLV
jgi:hypothetical protein